MKKTVKLLSLVLALLMIAVVMFACNKDEGKGEQESEEEKYLDLSPEQLYKKVGKAKNVTVTYRMTSEDYEEKMVFTKNEDVVKIKSEYSRGDFENEETNYVNLDTSDIYEEDDGKWFYEENELTKDRVERYIDLSALEEQYGEAFSKDNMFEKDNYDYEDDIYTFKSDVIDELNEESDIQIKSIVMERDELIYTFTARVYEADDEEDEGKIEVVVNFEETSVSFPEGAIEIKYEDYVVTVVDTNGDPISGVEVNVYYGDEIFETWAHTDEDGTATFNLQVGKGYYLTLVYNNYWEDVKYEIDDRYELAGVNTNITLYEKEKVVYKVTVSGKDGNYLKDLDVTLYNADTDSSVDWEYTNESGTVEFKFDESGNYYVRLYGVPDEYKWEDKYYFSGDDPLEIVLELKDVYTVTITDTKGRIVSDASVTMYNASGQYISSSYTDEDGVAKFIVDKEYNYAYVTVYSSDYGRYIIEDAYAFTDGKNLSIVLGLTKSYTINVVNNYGDPIQDVYVSLYHGEYYWSDDSGYTDENGMIEFYNLYEHYVYYVTLSNVPVVYSYDESYYFNGDTLTIYLTPKA